MFTSAKRQALKDRSVRGWLAVFAIAALIVGLGAIEGAFAQGRYSVSGVQVEASAADAVQAQVIALEEGQRRGLRQLVERLAAESGAAPPSTGGLAIEDYVSSFEVLSETVGPTSYAATLAIAYRPGAVDGLFRSSGTAVAAPAAEPTVLVPVWASGNSLLLWERENVWKETVDRSVAPDGLVRFTVPLGDLQDLSLLSADAAARGDAVALQSLAARYGTRDVVVATLSGSAAPGGELVVDAQRYGASPEPPYRAVVQRNPGEPLEASLQRAVAAMQATYDQRQREASTVPVGPRSQVVVVAPVGDLGSWGQLYTQINALAEVEASTLTRFTRREATLDLQVVGGVERLQATLGRSGWSLIEEPGTGWRLQRGSTSNPSTTAGPGAFAPSP
ncbi:MAG: DUF2066 domain-containing protein [Pseudomonadota bacterium]